MLLDLQLVQKQGGFCENDKKHFTTNHLFLQVMAFTSPELGGSWYEIPDESERFIEMGRHPKRSFAARIFNSRLEYLQG